MTKKYIKGKDGKFRGSVPDGKSVPTSLPQSFAPPVSSTDPEKYSALTDVYDKFKNAQEKRDFEIQAWRGDTGGASLYVNSKVDDISATVMESSDGKFTATVDVKYLDEHSCVDEKKFDSPVEAEQWAEEQLSRRTSAIKSFNESWEADAEQLRSNNEARVSGINGWVAQIDTSFGPPTGWMRAEQRGATVQRLGASGYLIRVHDYKNAYDQEGEMFLQKHLPDFDQAWELSRFLCSTR